DAGPELDAGVAAAEADGAQHDAAVTGRDLEGGVLDLLGLLAEDRAQQPLLGRGVLLALEARVTHEDVAGAHLGPDADDAVLVEVAQHRLGEARDVAGDLLGAELGVARLLLELLDV